MKIVRSLCCIAAMACSTLATARFSDSTHYYVKYASTGSINRTKDANAYLLNNSIAFKISRKKVVFNADGLRWRSISG